MNDVMLDLETLDNTPSSAVVAIGAVFFDPHSDTLGDTFYVTLSDIDKQLRYGRTVSGSTIRWWLQQDAAAREEIVNAKFETEQALQDFRHFLGAKEVRIWGNGAAFDNVILRSLYHSFGLEAPWGHRGDRCYRTVRAMSAKPTVVVSDFEGIKHHALHDAIFQAKVLQQINRGE